MKDMKDGAVNPDSLKSNTPDSIYSVHMADAGTDSHQMEKNFLTEDELMLYQQFYKT